jgi:hypothetical protein
LAKDDKKDEKKKGKDKKGKAVAVAEPEAEAPVEDAPAEAAPAPKAKATSMADDLGDDLMDLFTEDEIIDPTLGIMTATLDEVDIFELLEQVREIQDIMDERRGL